MSKGPGDSDLLGHRAVSAVRWTGASTVAAALLQVAQLVVLTRLLAPRDFGLMAMVSVVVGFAETVADMGISSSVIQRQDATVEELSSLYWLTIFIGGLVFVLLSAAAPLAASFFHEPRVMTILPWSATMFILTPLGAQFMALMQRDLEFGKLARIEAGAAFIGTTLSIGAAVLGAGVYALVCGQLVSAACRSGVAFVLAKPGSRPRFHFRWQDLERFWKFGLFQAGQQVVSSLSANLDRLLVGRLLGTVALGYYTVAAQIATKPRAVLNPVLTRVAFPVFSTVQEDNPRLIRGYLKMTEAVALLNVPMYAGLAVLAGPVVHTLLGGKWALSIPILSILSVMGILRSLANPIGSLVLAKGRADLGFWSNSGQLLLSWIAIVVAARWGTCGIATAELGVSAFTTAAIGFPIRRYLVGMSARQYIVAVSPYLASAAVMAAVLLPIVHIVFGPPQLRLGAQVLLGAAVYGVGVFAARGSTLRYMLATALKPARVPR